MRSAVTPLALVLDATDSTNVPQLYGVVYAAEPTTSEITKGCSVVTPTGDSKVI